MTYTTLTLQSVNCLRIDLSDPDVRLLPTPRATNYIAESSEVYSISVSNFVVRYGVQVATVANFYNTSQGTDPTVEGLPAQVFGLSISTGAVVSVPDTGPDSNNRRASILFTTNKVPSLMLTNAPASVNTTGLYTAVTGYFPVLTNGVILGDALITLYPDPTFHQLQPRTVFGMSADRRYFFMMVIDGRQNGYSLGANDADMGIWLLQFGAWDGVSMDGGGSASMYMADCAGNPKPLGHSSYIAGRNRERITGSQLGVYALPLPAFVNDVTAAPGGTTASISWSTLSNSTSQVDYGTTTNFGTLSPLASTLVTNHNVTLTGLKAGTRYYYRVLSLVGSDEYSSACGSSSFVTTNFGVGLLFGLTRDWKFNTNNLDGINWSSPNYNDSAWTNHGPGALWADSRVQGPPAGSTNLIPNFASGTRLPINGSYPFTTYYFRTPFVFSNNPAGVALTFSNYIDDGAAFYLNGAEVYRLNLIGAPNTFNNSSNAIAFTCSGDANCPVVFTVSGDLATNLVAGTNILAVEVHNYRNPVTVGNPSPDVVFESALFYTLPTPIELPPFITNVVAVAGETNAVITWTTLSNATSQILYGPTAALGFSNVLDSNLVANHVMVLTGLQPVAPYFFRVLSTVGTNQYSYDGTFSTVPFFQSLVTLSNSWRYTTNNLDGTNWTAQDYDDAGWLGAGPALLYIEDNVGVEPRNTALPAGANSLPMPTYYFRTHFTVASSAAGLSLLLTNYIDDGAVFYLNGREIQRVRMPAAPQPVVYTTAAASCPINNCEATQDVPDLFRVSGDALTNLIVGGDNVFAVEVHQFGAGSSDIVFGAVGGLVRALASETELTINQSSNVVCLRWIGEGLTLQRASTLTGTNQWADVPGAIRSGPHCVTNPAATIFYRLRN